MSTSADYDPQTPFDARLDAAPDADADSVTASAPVTSAPATPSSGAPTSVFATRAHAQWGEFQRDKLMPVLRRERQLSHAMQLAMAAVGGALLVVVTSTVIGVAIPHPDQATVANNQHPLVTVEDLTAKALKEEGVDGVQSRDANALSEEGNDVTVPGTPSSDEGDANPADAGSGSPTEDASEETEGDNGSATSLAALSSDPKRERKRARRQQDRILDEQRELEDRKRAIERQIEDKGLEERRRQEDQGLIESRMTDDQRRRDERRSEDERQRAEDDQREQSQNHDPKLAQVP